MNIGIFGDSFADIRWGPDQYQPGWPRWVHERMQAQGHHHARSGTSHWWSYQQFLEHHLNYDVVLFMHTSPTRWCSLPDSCPPRWQYNVGYHPMCEDLDLLNKYFFDVFPDDLRAFISGNIFRDVNTRCEQHQQQLVNLMMHTPHEHPITPTPFPVIWNLDGLSRSEMMQVDGRDISVTMWLHEQKIQDERVCHLNEQNNQHVADLVVGLLKHPSSQQLHLI